MNTKKVINQVLAERGMTTADLAAALDMQTQSFRNKVCRDSYSLNDFIKIMDILNCDVHVVTRDTNKSFY